MNIVEFDRSVGMIQKTIALTDNTLQYDKDFPNKMRKLFNKSLENTLTLLERDKDYKKSLSKKWHLAHRAVQFAKLHSKMKKIRQKILGLPIPHYFTRKIQQKIIPPLEKRVKEVRQYLGSVERLPFKKGGERYKFLQKVQNRLALASSQDISYAEKEYFHLLGNSLDAEQLKTIDKEPYNGSHKIYSIVSWVSIILEFIRQGDTREVPIGHFLLGMLNKARSIALKISYAKHLPNIKNLDDPKLEKHYLKDFIELAKEKEKPMCLDTGEAQKSFFQKYVLKDDGSIPLSVLIDEIAWDMKDSIDQMTPGETRVFPLGTYTHCVTVQVVCQEGPSQRSPEGKYTYTIFNTGDGVSDFHRTITTAQGEEKAKPLIFHGLPQTAFSYFFISELIRLSLQSSTVTEFYKLHDQYLVSEAGGIKDKESGAWHQIQKYGTCTYTSVEAWIDSYLQEDQIKHLEFIKIQHSMNKQQKVVRLLQEEQQKANEEAQQGETLTEDSSLKRKKLDASQLLLKLGEQHLQEITKDLSSTKRNIPHLLCFESLPI
jgi:hypothetical protein